MGCKQLKLGRGRGELGKGKAERKKKEGNMMIRGKNEGTMKREGEERASTKVSEKPGLIPLM